MRKCSIERSAGHPLPRSVRVGGLLLMALIAACAGTKPAPPAAPPQSAAPQAAATSATPSVPAPISPSPPPSAVAAQSAPAVLEPVERPAAASPAPSPNANAAKVAPPVKAATKVDAAPAPVAQPPKKEPAAAEAAKPPQAPPPLDLAALETRLKETKAIGVLTKITLKNQVDDLLSQFRAYYQGKVKTTLAELRRPFDLLILKVLSLLQDSDPTLAAAIAASREAIWGILSDPAKFATI